MNKFEQNTKIQTLSIVQNFIKYLIKDNVFPQVHQSIKLDIINKKIQSKGLKVALSDIFPKIIKQINAQKFGYGKNDQIVTQNFYKKQNKNLVRMYRKSCDDIKSFRSNQSPEICNHKNKWVQQYRQNKKEISQFHKLLIQSDRKEEIEKQKTKWKKDIFCKSKFRFNFCKINQDEDKQKTIENKRFQGDKCKQNDLLIKLQEQIQEQDLLISKKRQYLLKKKVFQKQFEQSFQKNQQLRKNKRKMTVYTSKKIKQQIQPNPFTTDYNGELIQIQGKQFNKLNNSFKLGFVKMEKSQSLKKIYQTVNNSPTKPLQQTNQDIKKFSFEKKGRNSELFVNGLTLKDKNKVRIKVKKQNLIEIEKSMNANKTLHNSRDLIIYRNFMKIINKLTNRQECFTQMKIIYGTILKYLQELQFKKYPKIKKIKINKKTQKTNIQINKKKIQNIYILKQIKRKITKFQLNYQQLSQQGLLESLLNLLIILLICLKYSFKIIYLVFIKVIHLICNPQLKTLVFLKNAPNLSKAIYIIINCITKDNFHCFVIIFLEIDFLYKIKVVKKNKQILNFSQQILFKNNQID